MALKAFTIFCLWQELDKITWDKKDAQGASGVEEDNIVGVTSISNFKANPK